MVVTMVCTCGHDIIEHQTYYENDFVRFLGVCICRIKNGGRVIRCPCKSYSENVANVKVRVR